MEMLQGVLSVEKDDVRRCRLWSWCGAFEGAKGQSRNRTKRLRLIASRDPGTPWCCDGAVVEVLQGWLSVEKDDVVSAAGQAAVAEP